MKKMKSLMLFIATMLLLAVMFCVNASAAEWKSLMDENFQFTYDKETGVMVIKGEGEFSSGLLGMPCPDHYNPEECICTTDMDPFPGEIEYERPEVYEAYCAALKAKTLILQEGINSLESSAFYLFSNVEVVIIPQSVTEIPAGAFYELKKLHTVVLSYSTTAIGEKAFFNCYNLRNIYLPDTVNTIAKSAFRGCDKNSIRIPSSIKNADELEFFGGKTKLKISSREGTKVYLSAVAPAIGKGCVYEFYRYDSTTKKYTKLAVQSSGSILLDDLNPGKTYYFVARAYQMTYTGKLYYNTSDLLTVEMPPVKPSKVTATQTDSSITLSWGKSPTATGYRIYYKTYPEYVTYDKVVVSATKATSHTFTELKSGNKYRYAVRPYIKTADGEVLWGDYIAIDVYTKPAIVTAKATSPSKGKINLTWNKVDGDIDGYRVYYKVGNGNYKVYKNYASPQALSFSDLKSGTKYTFAVRAGIKTNGGIVWGGYKTSTVTVK